MWDSNCNPLTKDYGYTGKVFYYTLSYKYAIKYKDLEMILKLEQQNKSGEWETWSIFFATLCC